jgi:hypothetical protein
MLSDSRNRKTFSRALVRTAIVGLALAAASPAAPLAAASYSAEYLAPFAVPAAINELGAVAGWNPVYGTAFVYDDERGYVELPCLKSRVCRALDLNDAGWIAGVAETQALVPSRRAVGWIPAKDGYAIFELPLPGKFRDSASIAVDNAGRFLASAEGRAGLLPQPVYFVWSSTAAPRILPVPGPAVDLSDAGWVVGNGLTPYRFHLRSSSLIFTQVPHGWDGAEVHAASPNGFLAGALVDSAGMRVAAMTDKDGNWWALGGAGTEDYLFGANAAGDVAGHVHGLDPESHCGVAFAEDGVLATLESYSFAETNLWKVGEVAGITANRWLAGEAVHETTGLPGLVRLKLAKTPWSCGETCVSVAKLTVASVIPDAAAAAYVAEITLAANRALPAATQVELTWLLDGGRRVVRTSVKADRDGRAESMQTGSAEGAEVYVTRLVAPNYTFDPTRGVLRAATKD